MKTGFFQKNLCLSLLFAFLFALVVVSPDIYALLKDFHAWAPINSYPYTIGDDYYYFSALNSINQRFISWPHDPLYPSHVSGIDAINILGYLVNLPFFKLGSWLLDQRLGILFVRLSNLALYFFAMQLFLRQISVGRKNNTSAHQITSDNHLITLWTFLLISNLTRFFDLSFFSYSSQIKTIFTPLLHFDTSSFNVFTRAIHASTTGPLLILSLTFLLYIFQNSKKQGGNYFFFFPIPIFLFFSFMHLPQAFVFWGLLFLLLLYRFKINLITVQKWRLITLILLAIGVLWLQHAILFSDAGSSEVIGIIFQNPFTSLTLTQDILIVFQALTPLILALLFYLIFRKDYPPPIFIIFSGVALCNLSNYIGASHTHLNRFWQRLAEIPYAALTFFFTWKLLERFKIRYFSRTINQRLSMTLCASTWLLMILFFFSNAVRLSQNFDRLSTRPDLLNYILTHQESERAIITNSTDLAYFAPLYSHRKIIFKDMLLQPHDYLTNFHWFMKNFAAMGVKKDAFISFLKKHQNELAYAWMPERPFTDQNFEKYSQYYADDILNLGLYRTFNITALNDRMITPNYVVTQKFFDFVDRNYPSNFDIRTDLGGLDLVFDLVASKILETEAPDKFKASRIYSLDGGNTLVLEDLLDFPKPQ